MKILGIHYGHNASVCLLDDDELVFAQSEERITRLKNSTGFPTATLDYLYEHVVPPTEIDMAVLYQKWIFGYLWLKSRGFEPVQYGHYLEPVFVEHGLKKRVLRTDPGWDLRAWRMRRTDRDSRLRTEAHAYFSGALRLPPDKVKYLDHHLAHAYSTVANVRDWERALIFTLDGVGDYKCASVNLWENGRLRTISTDDHRNSLGYYYAATTSILGMKSGEHEYKVMGLAPYARPAQYRPIVERLQKLLWIEDGHWRSRPNPEALLAALEETYRFKRFDNVAGAIQEHTEATVLAWIRHWMERTGCADVAVAGGVFMNVKLNQKVLGLDKVRRLFVMPSASDESCPIGCVAWASDVHTPDRPMRPLDTLYLGQCFDDAAIARTLDDSDASQRYEISRPADMITAIADRLARNEVVARCSGRMEFGARALGNRSILANPSDVRNVQLINDAIKNRDFWMPFTPSILSEDMPRYVVGYDRIAAPYMAITFDSTAAARQDLPAAMHPRDHTVRPQAVTRQANPEYHDIIAAFKARTGIGAVLNTSLNLHGEPMVCSPADAIHTLDESKLPHLAMGSFLLSRRGG